MRPGVGAPVGQRRRDLARHGAAPTGVLGRTEDRHQELVRGHARTGLRGSRRRRAGGDAEQQRHQVAARRNGVGRLDQPRVDVDHDGAVGGDDGIERERPVPGQAAAQAVHGRPQLREVRAALTDALPFTPSRTRSLAWKAIIVPASKTLWAITRVPVRALLHQHGRPGAQQGQHRRRELAPVVDAAHADDAVPIGALTNAGKADHASRADGSRTTTERGWATPAASNVARADTLSCTRASAAKGGTAVHRPAAAQARELVRQDRHLLLGGEHDLDVQRDGSFQDGVEPPERVRTERGDPHEAADVPGEAGEAQRVAHRREDLVAELVEPGRDLPRRQSRALGQQHSHGAPFME